jgi:hypothetical protein
MRAAVAASVLALSGGSAVHGQQQINPGSVAYTLEYDRVAATGAVLGPGPLQEGEWARLRLRFNYSPAYGTPVTWPYTLLINSSGSGTLAGFWYGNLDLIGSGGAEGTWSGTSAGSLPVRRVLTAPFNVYGDAAVGIPNATGTALANLQPGQFTGNLESVSSSNNLVVWQGAWLATSYSPRSVTFSLAAGSLGLPTYLVARDGSGYELPIAGTVADTRGSVTFEVVPGPGSIAIIGVGALIGVRRCRSRSPSTGEAT